MSKPLSLHSAVVYALRNKLDLVGADSVEEALASTGASRYRRPKYYLVQNDSQSIALRCGEGLEFSCSGLIADHNTATLAVVQLAQDDMDFAKAIRDAVSLRHTLLQRHEFLQRTYSVELLFVVQDNREQLVELTKQLQENMTKTSYLHAIGINLLVCDLERWPSESSIRRAFSWLLTGVRKWYGSNNFRERFSSGKKKTEGKKLKTLTMENLRLFGRRIWQKEQEHKLHLIHGHNGTGKSTFTEAYELLVTGKIDRLKDEDDYRRILRHREPQKVRDAGRAIAAEEPNQTKSPARVEAEYVGGKNENWHIGKLGLEADPDSNEREFSNIDSGSFRMEQGFADDLVRSGRGIQMGRFLAAFFPKERDAVRQYADALEKFNSAWGKLSKLVQLNIQTAEGNDNPEPETVLSVIGKCWDADNSIDVDAVLKISPIPNLRQLLTDAKEQLDLSLSLEHVTVADLDDAWRKAKAGASDLVHDFDSWLPSLRQINQWTAPTTTKDGTKEDLAALINSWLEACVLCDLLKKEVDVLGVTSEMDDVSELLLGRSDLGTQENFEQQKNGLNDSIQKRDTLRQELAELSLGGSATNDETLMVRPEVSDTFYSYVNDYVTGTNEAPASFFRRGLSQNVKASVSFSFEGKSATVGVAGGLSTLIDWLNKKLLVANRIREPDGSFNIQQLVDDLADLRDAANACLEVEQANVEQFKNQLKGPLADAFNELIALFTPARWAYQDIIANVNDDSGTTEFQMDGISADLLLNTAELNTLALVLFFLCAPSDDKPIRMLLLDDPFQNMDELTVTKISRGLKRLLRVWELDRNLKHWEVLILLHGEENLERLRSECRSAVYFLKWLSPTAIAEATSKDTSLERNEIAISSDDDPRSDDHSLEGVENLIVDIS